MGAVRWQQLSGDIDRGSSEFEVVVGAICERAPGSSCPGRGAQGGRACDGVSTELSATVKICQVQANNWRGVACRL